MDFPISVPSIGLVDGKFVDEDPLLGTPGSLIPAQWGNAVTEEILNVIAAAGMLPDEGINTQLATAISEIIATARPLASQVEAEDGANNTKVMTPLRTLQSILKRLATQAQVYAGEDDTTTVTPLKLAQRLALNSPIAGGVRNARMSVPATAASASFTTDEVVVKSALGGASWLLSGFNKAINLGTIEAGGMDTGSAPVNGWVALYAIFNPTTGVSALLAKDATSATQPEVYGGANMPAGYTASALLAVVPTNASSQFPVLYVIGRSVDYFKQVYSGAGVGAFSILAISSAVPLNAKSLNCNCAITASAAGALSAAICTTVNGVGNPGYSSIAGYAGAAGNIVGGHFRDIPVMTPQTIFLATGGTGTYAINSYGYKF